MDREKGVRKMEKKVGQMFLTDINFSSTDVEH